MNVRPDPSGGGAALSANDRLKRSWKALVWGGILAATAAHFALFSLWPTLRAPDIGVHAPVVQARGLAEVSIPADVKIPVAPGPIARPATPAISRKPIPEDVTIRKMDFSSLAANTLPTPPVERGAEGGGGGTPGAKGSSSAQPAFTPYDIAPAILNRTQVLRAMEKVYPTVYRETRTGGVVLMYFYIDTRGRVRDCVIAQSSGYPTLDSAAVKVARVYRFSPASYRDKKTAVWVQIPISFSVH